jgi:hypothetical protein
MKMDLLVVIYGLHVVTIKYIRSLKLKWAFEMLKGVKVDLEQTGINFCSTFFKSGFLKVEYI